MSEGNFGDWGVGIDVDAEGFELGGAGYVHLVVVDEGVEALDDEAGSDDGRIEGGDECAVFFFVFCLEFGEEVSLFEAFGEEEKEDLWNLDFVSHLDARCAFLSLEVFDGVIHDEEGVGALEIGTGPACAVFEGVFGDVLDGEGYLTTCEDDGPRELEPCEEQREEGEAAIYGTGVVDTDLEGDVDPLDNLEGGAGDYARDERGGELDLGIGHDKVEERKDEPKHDIRAETENEVLDGAGHVDVERGAYDDIGTKGSYEENWGEYHDTDIVCDFAEEGARVSYAP